MDECGGFLVWSRWMMLGADFLFFSCSRDRVGEEGCRTRLSPRRRKAQARFSFFFEFDDPLSLRPRTLPTNMQASILSRASSSFHDTFHFLCRRKKLAVLGHTSLMLIIEYV